MAKWIREVFVQRNKAAVLRGAYPNEVGVRCRQQVLSRDGGDIEPRGL
jgi:hypothetical protein